MTDLPPCQAASELRRLTDAALSAVAPDGAVLRHLHLDGGKLTLIDESGAPAWSGGLDAYRRIRVLGAGKGAAPMAAALENLLGDRISDGLVIVKYGHDLPEGQRTRHIRIKEGGHPVPDEAGAAAAGEIVDMARDSREDDLVLCTFTGGASALTPARHPEIPYSMIDDRYSDCGPMSGLYSALSVCESDALLVLPCDVPLFSGTLAHHLQEVMKHSDTDALICVTADDRIHPLCGIYRKSCTPVLKRCLDNGNLRIMDALNNLKVHFYHVEEDSWQLQNINTPEEYQKLTAKSCLAISGFKNSGKTTLMERLIPELIHRGLKVATVKHDGHSFEPDSPGTDSYRFWQAGVSASIVYDNDKYSVVKREPLQESAIAGLVGDADLVLLEGFKWSDYPKLILLTGSDEQNNSLLASASNCISYITADFSTEQLIQDTPVYCRDNIEAIADCILQHYHNGDLKHL